MAQALLEILKSDRATNPPIFTVNTAASEVSIVQAVPSPLLSVDEEGVFVGKDSPLILTVAVKLPYGFCFGSIAPALALSHGPSRGAGGLTRIAVIHLPFDGVEIELKGPAYNGLFVPNIYDPADVLGMQLFVTLGGGGTVSMLNVPDSMNAQSFYIDVYAKLQHLLPMNNED